MCTSHLYRFYGPQKPNQRHAHTNTHTSVNVQFCQTAGRHAPYCFSSLSFCGRCLPKQAVKQFIKSKLSKGQQKKPGGRQVRSFIHSFSHSFIHPSIYSFISLTSHYLFSSHCCYLSSFLLKHDMVISVIVCQNRNYNTLPF